MASILHCLSVLAFSVGSTCGARLGLEQANPALRFAKRGNPNELPHVSFPMSEAGANDLKDTNAISVRWFGHWQVQEALGKDLKTWDGVVRDVWGGFEGSNAAYLPSHPDGSETDKQHFWSEFREVLAAQQMRRANVLTNSIMPVHPLFDADETMNESAQRVRADFPTDFPTMQIKRLLKSGGLQLDPKIFRREECNAGKEFVNGPVALSGLAGWAITTVSPAAFGSKWHVGRIRPEEAAVLVKSQGLAVEEAVQSAVEAMGLSEAAEFTAYAEGSPVHPAWPAMHSAASSMSSWLDIVADLTDAQRDEVQLLDFSIAYWRTFAGVHWPSDNRAGLALGQYIIKKSLPSHLADMYACNDETKKLIHDYVQAKIESREKSHPVNWATWTPKFWNPPQWTE